VVGTGTSNHSEDRSPDAARQARTAAPNPAPSGRVRSVRPRSFQAFSSRAGTPPYAEAAQAPQPGGQPTSGVKNAGPATAARQRAQIATPGRPQPAQSTGQTSSQPARQPARNPTSSLVPELIPDTLGDHRPRPAGNR